MSLRRSLMSLVLLLAAIGSFVEPIVGQVRDGVVHHRTEAHAAEEAGDAALASAAHAPQEREATSPNSDHEHGTSTDHCTHQHSVALLPSLDIALPAQTFELSPLDPPSYLGRFAGQLFHPPRA